LYVQSVSPNATVDGGSDIIKGIEKGYTDPGGVIVKREYKKLHNVNFYVLTGAQKVSNGTVNGVNWVGIVNGRMYQISLIFREGDPAKDETLTAAINSFSISTK
jgi:predicted type IV restriction endonuclease